MKNKCSKGRKRKLNSSLNNPAKKPNTRHQSKMANSNVQKLSPEISKTLSKPSEPTKSPDKLTSQINIPVTTTVNSEEIIRDEELVINCTFEDISEARRFQENKMNAINGGDLFLMRSAGLGVLIFECSVNIGNQKNCPAILKIIEKNADGLLMWRVIGDMNHNHVVDVPSQHLIQSQDEVISEISVPSDPVIGNSILSILKKTLKGLNEAKRIAVEEYSAHSPNSEIAPRPKKTNLIQTQWQPQNYEEIKSGYSEAMAYKDLEEDFVYCISNKNKHNTLYHLRCQFSRQTKKHEACPATAKLDLLSNRLYKNVPHNHGSNDRNSMIKNLTRETLNKIEENPTDNSRKIFNQVAKKYPEVKHKTSFTKIESAAFYRSNKHLPTNPKNLEEIMETLDEYKNHPIFRYYRKTVRYLDKNAEVCGLIFGHENLIRAFENASDVGKDGTFWVCPQPFRQVYILMFRKDDSYFPGFICLLMRKSKTVYKPCFKIIYKEEVPKFVGQHFHFDFEEGPRDETMDLMNEIAQEEPDRCCLANCECDGCMFHYSKGLLDNVKKLGLIGKYWRAPHFRFWIRKIVMLCLLPSQLIQMVWELHLEPAVFTGFDERANLNLQEFKRYVSGQWIYKSGMVEFLSLYNTDITTNNPLESLNKKFKKKIETKQPNLFDFLTGMNELLDEEFDQFMRLLEKVKIKRNEVRKSDHNKKHIEFAVSKLEDESFDPIDFIEYLAKNFNSKFFEAIRPTNTNQQQQQTENENDCVLCLLPRENENWGYKHIMTDGKSTIHSKFCAKCIVLYGVDENCPINSCQKKIEEIVALF